MFFKKLRFFLFELIDFGLEESAVGKRNVTFNFVLSQFLEIGTKASSKMSEAHYDVIMFLRNLPSSSVLVQSLILDQSKIILATQGF